MTSDGIVTPLPRLIAWEITRRCPLACLHCRASALDAPYENELTTDEIIATLENIAGFAKPVVILTGGEPMLRPDVWDIASRGAALGLRMAMAPCGGLVTPETVRRMRESGIQRISLSIDGPEAAMHDAFRGVAGAFDSVIRAATFAREGGLSFQVNTTIARHNLNALEAIFDLAVRIGAAAFHPFLLVPTGRGRNLENETLSPEDYERALEWVFERSRTSPIPFKPTCAPHYHRIVRQKGGTMPAMGHPGGLDAMTKGCMGGQAFAFVSHTGKVQICGFMDVECGDLRASDFATIWKTSPVFLAVRDTNNYHGRCGVCEYRKVCGGCRARAYAATGDYLGEEPMCRYVSESNK
jgi:heme b synthase